MEITEIVDIKEEPKPKRQTLCLNMIVKNESHIIKESLTKLTQKLKFDYWVISDTGSTDNTPNIITDFFREINIPGEMHFDVWKDFGHNRTLAIEYAYKKTDYILVFDADDEIIGNLVLPPHLDQDAYKLIFGNAHSYSYERPLLMNNHQKWQYLGVLHEYLDSCGRKMTIQTLSGDYSVLSGRKGSRSSDPDKYLKDALVLEKAYANEVNTNGSLKDRYAFYCANSYFDYNNFEKAIEWYKITLKQNGWDQEKYIACLKLYKCYKRLNNFEQSHYYLVKAHNYDRERTECVYKLVVHHCCENHNDLAYHLYSLIKDYYENKYIVDNATSNKLFLDNRVANFYLPYYMIIIGERTKHFDTGIKMYQIIFIKKVEGVSRQHVGNVLFNFKFFIGFLNELNKEVPQFVTHIYELFNNYITFLMHRNYDLEKFDFFGSYKDVLNAVNKAILLKNDTSSNSVVVNSRFSQADCKSSKNILFFAGFCDKEWNYTFGLNNALGGSERAVNFIASSFPKDYNIIVSGNVKEETVGNVQYIHLFKLNDLFKVKCFHTIIVSRYISFYAMFPESCTYQSYIWAHDTSLSKYGCNIEPLQILKTWDNKITGAVCLTNWHANHIAEQFPTLKNKMHIINNGIVPSLFVPQNGEASYEKIKNMFVYTSCPERGLSTLLDLWPRILEILPDAQLKIAAYNIFPANPEDVKLQTIIKTFPNSIEHCGKLNPVNLYKLMGQSEYWLYPCNWPETSCITALEMLHSGTICLYYPSAGLTDTMGIHGFKMVQGEEINLLKQLSELSKEEKEQIILDGKTYAQSCSWDNRANIWTKMLFKRDASSSKNLTDATAKEKESIRLTITDDINDRNLTNISNLSNIKYLNLDFNSKPKSDKPLSNDVTIVTAFLDIGRGNWSNWKRDDNYYINSFFNYFEVDYKMIVFIDEKCIQRVLDKYNTSKFKNKLFIPINLDWLKTNIYAWRQLEKDRTIISSQEYKTNVGSLLNEKCPENLFSEYNIVNHSKIDFINYVIDNNLIHPGCDFICWSDFGVHRAIYNTNHFNYPKNVLDVNMFNRNKITMCSKNKIIEQYADPLYILQKAPIIIHGSFFGGSIKKLKELQILYHEALEELYDINISDDDQHVYLRCFIKNPELFEIYLTQNYPNALTYFEHLGDNN